ncbi:MAG: molybdenum cofactor guanylyltransferase MobA [Burkholderiaceae bacterium]
MIDRSDITGVVLAGGQGTRMGGADKGLQPFNGVPLARNALERLAPQVSRLAVNANRNAGAYEAFGAPVWPDTMADHPGPLAGMLAGLERCETPWLAAVPCDVPLFPPDLVHRLAGALEGAEMAMALAPGEDGVLRPQPVFCLMHVRLRASLAEFLAEGGRKAGAWAALHRAVRVPFEGAQAIRAFANVNTLAELHRLEGA